MPNPTPELPEEITTQILQEAEIYSEEAGEYIRNVHEYSTHSDINTGYIAGAEKYAAIALQLQNALALISEYGPDKYVAEVCKEALSLFPVDKKKEDGE